MSKLAIKERIINILNYKKPGFWGLLAAVIICIVSIVCFLTTPSQPTESENAGETEFSGTEEIIAHYEDYDELLKALANDFSSRSGNSKLFYVCPGDDTPSLTTLNKVSDIQLFFKPCDSIEKFCNIDKEQSHCNRCKSQKQANHHVCKTVCCGT